MRRIEPQMPGFRPSAVCTSSASQRRARPPRASRRRKAIAAAAASATQIQGICARSPGTNCQTSGRQGESGEVAQGGADEHVEKEGEKSGTSHIECVTWDPE